MLNKSVLEQLIVLDMKYLLVCQEEKFRFVILQISEWEEICIFF